jgi:hypothetical protein
MLLSLDLARLIIVLPLKKVVITTSQLLTAAEVKVPARSL